MVQHVMQPVAQPVIQPVAQTTMMAAPVVQQRAVSPTPPIVQQNNYKEGAGTPKNMNRNITIGIVIFIIICIALSNQKYKYVAEHKTHWEAMEHCHTMGRMLARQRNFEDIKQIKELGFKSSEFDHLNFIHVDGYAKVWPEFYYEDGTLVNSDHWERNEPNNFIPPEKCVGLGKNTALVDLNCATKFHFVCERKDGNED